MPEAASTPASQPGRATSAGAAPGSRSGYEAHPDPSPDAGTPVARGPVFKRLGLLLVGFTIGIFIFDRGLGWADAAADLSDTKMHQADPELGWTIHPGFHDENISINSMGLRGPEVPAHVPADEVRILGIGASNTFGAGVGGGNRKGQPWSEHLQADCDTRYKDVRVLNGGVMGYSTVQAARRALRLLPVVQPDLILLFLPPGSQSLLDPSSARHYVHVGEKLLPKDIADECPDALLPLAAATHDLLNLSAIYRRYRARASDEGRRAPDIDKFVLSRAPHSAEADAMLQRTWSELEVLAKAAHDRGVEVRVVEYYEDFMDSDAAWRAYLHDNAAAGAPPAGTPREEPLEVLREGCEQRGLAVWNISDAITQIGTDHAKYTIDERHWSGDGHELVARAIFEHLVQEDLVDTLRRARAGRPRD